MRTDHFALPSMSARHSSVAGARCRLGPRAIAQKHPPILVPPFSVLFFTDHHYFQQVLLPFWPRGRAPALPGGYLSSGALPPRNRSPSSRPEASRRWVVFCPLMAARASRPLVLAAGVSARTRQPVRPAKACRFGAAGGRAKPAQCGGFPRLT